MLILIVEILNWNRLLIIILCNQWHIATNSDELSWTFIILFKCITCNNVIIWIVMHHIRALIRGFWAIKFTACSAIFVKRTTLCWPIELQFKKHFWHQFGNGNCKPYMKMHGHYMYKYMISIQNIIIKQMASPMYMYLSDVDKFPNLMVCLCILSAMTGLAYYCFL